MKTCKYGRLAGTLLVLGLLGWTASGVADIASTKHNLSATGTGTYKAATETRLCVFCHVMHNADPAVPLWNHQQSAATYIPYGSNTLATAQPGQPTGASRLCLTCHDGTVALGGVKNVLGSSVPVVISGLEALLTGSGNLGTDLRDDHPISFTYDAALTVQNPELVSPAALTGMIKPDGNSQLQCTSCHDPHSGQYPKFLHVGYTDGAGYGSPLCRTCHNKMYWSTVPNMSHREQTRQWNGAGLNPWHVPGHNLANDPNSTNKANGCESCHQSHNAAVGATRILKQDGKSGVCLVCHNGNVVSSTKNIDASMNRMYGHPSKNPADAGRHNPKRMSDGKVREDPADLANRHAVCEDCHNPHAVSPGVSPSIPNPTNNLAAAVSKGVWGVQPTWPGLWGQVTSYSLVPDVQYQYQLCLKCHSYYAFGASPPPDPYGMVAGGVNTDQALEFNPNNPSYHPVVTTGKNTFTMTVGGTPYNYSSSLIGGMTPSSTMTCSECHSDTNPVFLGPKGPHGSDVWPILWGTYDGSTGVSGTEDHLCYTCHKASVYGPSGGSSGNWQATGFSGPGGTGGLGPMLNLHYRHLELRQVPCQGCHSAVPHGWKRRAMLVFGTGTPDPAPYNSHSKFPIGGSSAYGIPASLNVDAVTSGSWTRSLCHSGTGVGSCM
jgi:predicted CXXCH cytochrome family protein